eukprot:GHVP01069997.1.p1 GENE.GHVP01069997.1~~GHVP01069997.1.p1  ORF type:complete len:647 (+),score=92.59 GHVP01069997.1:2534-4474(+)
MRGLLKILTVMLNMYFIYTSNKYLLFSAEDLLYAIEITNSGPSMKTDIEVHNDKGFEIKKIETQKHKASMIGKSICKKSHGNIYDCNKWIKEHTIIEGIEKEEFLWTECKGDVITSKSKDGLLLTTTLHCAERLFTIRKRDGIYEVKDITEVNMGMPFEGREACETTNQEFTEKFSEHSDSRVSNNISKLILYSRAEYGKITTKENTISIGMVADYSYFAKFDTHEEVSAEIIRMMGIINKIYIDEIGLNVVISRILIMDTPSGEDADEEEFLWNMKKANDKSAKQVLKSFSKWRSLQADDESAVYHLLSSHNFKNTLGLAYVGSACIMDELESSSTGVSLSVYHDKQFYTILHELAHNFGASHDCDSDLCMLREDRRDGCRECEGCDCEGKYIMTPICGKDPNLHFSPASKTDMIDYFILRGDGCLQSMDGIKMRENAFCGNGIREKGEECDCGDDESCRNSKCCLPGCKLKPGAECSDDNDECCRDCKIIPKSENYICRKSNTVCELDAVCQGDSERCPVSKRANNGTKCEFTDVDGSLCADGVCTGKKRQCKELNSGERMSGTCNGTFGGCSMNCETESGLCLIFSRIYKNGTSCGVGGFCQEGSCKHSFSGVMKKTWPIIVAVLVTVLLIVFISILYNRRGA